MNWTRNWAFALAILAIALVSLSSGLFEDQAGKDDWIRQHVGKVLFAHYDPRPLEDQVFVVSEQGAVAALATTQGKDTIVWRRLLPEGSKVVAAKTCTKGIAVLTTTQMTVFDLEGNLIFQTTFPASSLTDMTQTYDVIHVAILYDGELQQYSSSDWKTSRTKDVMLSVLKLSAAAGSAYLLVQAPDGIGVQAASGGLPVPTTLTMAQVEASQMACTATHMILASASHLVFVPLPVNGKIGAITQYELPSSTSINAEKDIVLLPLTGPLVAVNNQAIYNEHGLISLIGSSGDESAPSRNSHSPDLYSLSCNSAEKCHLAVMQGSQVLFYDLKTLSAIPKSGAALRLPISSSPSTTSSVATLAFLLKPSSTDNQVIVQWLIQTQNWTLTAGSSLVNAANSKSWDSKKTSNNVSAGTTVHWVREEALGAITASIIVDLPARIHEALLLEDGAHLLHRLQVHYEQLRDWLDDLVAFAVGGALQRSIESLLSMRFADALNEWREEHSKEALHKDHFGFAKLLVAATQANSLVALHSLGRNVVWTSPLPQDLSGATVTHLLATRKTSPSGPIMSVFAKDGTSSYSFDLLVLSGTIQNVVKYQFDIAKILSPSHLVDSQGDQVVLLVDKTQQLWALPPTTSSAHYVLPRNTFHYYLADEDTGIITGYGLAESVNITSQKKPVALKSAENWQINLGAPIDALAQTERHTISPGKVVGVEKNVLPKYINPNAVAVGYTLKTNVAASAEDKKSDKSSLSLQVVVFDSVTGSIIHRIVHKGATGRPIVEEGSQVEAVQATHPMRMKLVFSDHWLLFSYWSTRATRFELTSVELFEKEASYEKGITGATTAHALMPDLDAKAQSFILAGGLRALALTSSHLGVANQDALLVYQDGKVSQLPSKFLDPRRPAVQDSDPTLRAYFAFIPLEGSTIINYYNMIGHMNAIHTHPTALESSSIVWVVGLDSFVRLIAQSSFDRLAHDYSFLQIFTILIGLAIAVYIFKSLSKRKELKEKWK